MVQCRWFEEDLVSGVVSWFDAHVHGCTSSASQLLINIDGQLILAITGFMLLVFMTTHPFHFHFYCLQSQMR